MTGPSQRGCLFADLPSALTEEQFDVVASAPGVRVERIISTGQATPEGEWYDQPDNEWVALLSGGAGLLFEGEETARTLAPGDWVLIPAHARHRVEWTAPNEATVWLAVHFGAGVTGDT